MALSTTALTVADPNPLHADPAVAKAAGFPPHPALARHLRPFAGHAFLRSLCGLLTPPARLTAIAGRSRRRCFPARLRTERWRDGAVVSFRARRGRARVVAINNGRAQVQG